jgi:hypothetical protein
VNPLVIKGKSGSFQGGESFGDKGKKRQFDELRLAMMQRDTIA